MIELFHDPNYNFIGRRKWAYIISLIITLIGLISLATKGLHYDIDFTGGTLVQLRFEQPPSVANIRAGLSRIKLGESIIQQFGDPQEYIIRMPLTATSSEELPTRKLVTAALCASSPSPLRPCLSVETRK